MRMFIIFIALLLPEILLARLNLFEVEEPMFQRKWAEVMGSDSKGMKYGVDLQLTKQFTYAFALVDLPMKKFTKNTYLSSTVGFNLFAQSKKEQLLPKEYLGGSARFVYGASFYSEYVKAHAGLFLKTEGLNADSLEQQNDPLFEAYRDYPRQKTYIKPYIYAKVNKDVVSLKTIYSYAEEFSKPAFAHLEPNLTLFAIYTIATSLSYRNVFEAKEKTSFAQMGLKQELLLSKGGNLGDVAVVLDIDNTYQQEGNKDQSNNSIPEALKNFKDYVTRVELQSPLYVGFWYNEDMGFGGGIGMHFKNLVQQDIKIKQFEFKLKWNDMVKDPVLDRKAGFSIRFAATI